jgi:hypothetical protein
MKALSLWQPWASMIQYGYKKVETRSWYTAYRGNLLICSAKKKSRDLEAYFNNSLLPAIPLLLEYECLPLGEALVICRLDNCFEISKDNISLQSELELKMGNWEPGRFAWQFSNIRPLAEPFNVVGKQGLFEVDI